MHVFVAVPDRTRAGDVQCVFHRRQIALRAEVSPAAEDKDGGEDSDSVELKVRQWVGGDSKHTQMPVR